MRLLIDSLYHLYVDANVNLNEQIMSAVGQKRSRDEINQKYLWHDRLGHIGVLEFWVWCMHMCFKILFFKYHSRE